MSSSKTNPLGYVLVRERLRCGWVLGVQRSLPGYPQVLDVQYELCELLLRRGKGWHVTSTQLTSALPHLTSEQLDHALAVGQQEGWLVPRAGSSPGFDLQPDRVPYLQPVA